MLRGCHPHFAYVTGRRELDGRDAQGPIVSSVICEFEDMGFMVRRSDDIGRLDYWPFVWFIECRGMHAFSFLHCHFLFDPALYDTALEEVIENKFIMLFLSIVQYRPLIR
jgi:hypothetical protein